jgi:hypothetical protein
MIEVFQALTLKPSIVAFLVREQSGALAMTDPQKCGSQPSISPASCISLVGFATTTLSGVGILRCADPSARIEGFH